MNPLSFIKQKLLVYFLYQFVYQCNSNPKAFNFPCFVWVSLPLGTFSKRAAHVFYFGKEFKACLKSYQWLRFKTLHALSVFSPHSPQRCGECWNSF